MVLNKKELMQIEGGSTRAWLAIGGIAVFLLGVFCGFFGKQKGGLSVFKQ